MLDLIVETAFEKLRHRIQAIIQAFKSECQAISRFESVIAKEGRVGVIT